MVKEMTTPKKYHFRLFALLERSDVAPLRALYLGRFDTFTETVAKWRGGELVTNETGQHYRLIDGHKSHRGLVCREQADADTRLWDLFATLYPIQPNPSTDELVKDEQKE
jgi:hypothetical protein